MKDKIYAVSPTYDCLNTTHIEYIKYMRSSWSEFFFLFQIRKEGKALKSL